MVINDLKEVFNKICIMDDAGRGLALSCCLGERSLQFDFNKDEHHFEIEIFDDHTVELFYRNRITGEYWGF